MKKLFHTLVTVAAFSLVSHPATANELAEQTQELEALTDTVAERERQLEESESTLKAQSETLRCLSKLLEAYNACETQHTLRSEEHRTCLSTDKASHAGCAS